MVWVFFTIGLTWSNYAFKQHLALAFPDEYERVDFFAEGEVEGLPSNKNGDVSFYFRVTDIDEKLPEKLIGTRFSLSCYRCEMTINPHDKWRFTLRVKRPHGYASWGAFDYEKYLFRNRVIAKGYIRPNGENTLISRQSATLHNWRQSIRERLANKLEEGVALNIILALTVGDKSSFTNEQRKVFQDTGTSHLIAISGLHVGLVFIFVSNAFRYFLWPFARIFEIIPRSTLVIIPALGSAILYSGFAGFAVSTQRALTMLLVYVACKLLAREVSLLKVLLLAAAILLIIDPFSILDLGFWLSCCAVLVIALISESRQKSQAMSLFKLQPLLWLGMLPITIGFFGQISFISPLVNLIVVPLFCVLLIPLSLISVSFDALGLVTISSFMFNSLELAFTVIYDVLHWCSQLKIAKSFVAPLAWWHWLLFAISMGALYFKRRICLLLFPLFLLSLILRKPLMMDHDELRVALLDVGQGLAMVIHTSNSVMVYDTGPRYPSGFTAASAVLLPYLRYHGIRVINTLVISHADNDHIGGYQAVIDAVQVNEVVSSRVDKIPTARSCDAGDEWFFDKSKISVLSPDEETPEGSNNRSCVLLIEHLGSRILLSGDIEKQVERDLVSNYRNKLNADFLLVPHQGSKTSSTASFLDAVAPKVAMLAAGYKNHYRHPHESVLARYAERGIDLYSTIDSGSILLKINRNGWFIQEFRRVHKRFWHYQKLPQSGS